MADDDLGLSPSMKAKRDHYTILCDSELYRVTYYDDDAGERSTTHLCIHTDETGWTLGDIYEFASIALDERVKEGTTVLGIELLCYSGYVVLDNEDATDLK